jgi:hypothetical protein
VTYDAWICSFGSDIELEYQTSYSFNIAKDSSPSLYVSDKFETVDEMNSFMNKISPNLKFTENEGSICKGRVGFLCEFIEYSLDQRIRNGDRDGSISEVFLRFLVDQEEGRIAGCNILMSYESLVKMMSYIYYSIIFGNCDKKVKVDYEYARNFQNMLRSIWIPYDTFKFTIDQPLACFTFSRQKIHLFRYFFEYKNRRFLASRDVLTGNVLRLQLKIYGQG